MTKNNEKITTTSELRSVLLQTIQGVRSGDITHQQGSTIASLSKAVLHSAKLDFEVFKFHQGVEENDRTKLKAIELDK